MEAAQINDYINKQGVFKVLFFSVCRNDSTTTRLITPKIKVRSVEILLILLLYRGNGTYPHPGDIDFVI